MKNTVFSQFEINGAGEPLMLGCWKEYLADTIIKDLESFNWGLIKYKNYLDIEKFSVEPAISNTILSTAYSEKNHIKWKICDFEHIPTDREKLYRHLRHTFDEFKVWVTRIEPGNCIPQHFIEVDEFLRQNQIHQIKWQYLRRYEIFPCGVKPWNHHWFGLKILPVGYPGDCFKVNYWEVQGSSNLGKINDYIINVIGIEKQP
jgi:hypothetical protein